MRLYASSPEKLQNEIFHLHYSHLKLPQCDDETSGGARLHSRMLKYDEMAPKRAMKLLSFHRNFKIFNTFCQCCSIEKSRIRVSAICSISVPHTMDLNRLKFHENRKLFIMLSPSAVGADMFVTCSSHENPEKLQ